MMTCYEAACRWVFRKDAGAEIYPEVTSNHEKEAAGQHSFRRVRHTATKNENKIRMSNALALGGTADTRVVESTRRSHQSA